MNPTIEWWYNYLTTIGARKCADGCLIHNDKELTDKEVRKVIGTLYKTGYKKKKITEIDDTVIDKILQPEKTPTYVVLKRTKPVYADGFFHN